MSALLLFIQLFTIFRFLYFKIDFVQTFRPLKTKFYTCEGNSIFSPLLTASHWATVS